MYGVRLSMAIHVKNANEHLKFMGILPVAANCSLKTEYMASKTVYFLMDRQKLCRYNRTV